MDEHVYQSGQVITVNVSAPKWPSFPWWLLLAAAILSIRK
jgi:hypothetical protein